MLALIAAQEAASFASGHGSPLTAPIGTGTVDGFAAGMLLSAVVFLLILAQRRALRRPVGAGVAAGATRATAATAATAGPVASVTPAGPAHTAQAHAGPAHTGQAHAGPAHTAQAHAGPAHTGPAHTGQAHAGPTLTQDPALGLYPAPVLPAPALAAPFEAEVPAPVLAAPFEAEVPAPVLAAPFEAEVPAPFADLPTPLADLPAPPADLPAQLTDLPAPLADLPTPLSDSFMTANYEVPERGDRIVPTLSTHPYADVSPFAGASAPARFMPFADAANEVVLQPGARLEEWLEGEMRRPSLPKRIPATRPSPVSAFAFEPTPPPTAPPPTAPASTESATMAPATNVPAAVAAAEATTAVVPAVPATPSATTSSDNSAEPDLADESGHHRRAPAYQSKHRLVGRNDSKPWPDSHRRGARHAAASPTRSGVRSRRFGLRQLRPVSAGD